MPYRDGTGPYGQGSLTGRGLGPCEGGSSRGFGWRCKRRFLPAEPVHLTREEQKKILEAELKEIESEKQEIDKRLKELE